jgi:hypothetical protein
MIGNEFSQQLDQSKAALRKLEPISADRAPIELTVVKTISCLGHRDLSFIVLPGTVLQPGVCTDSIFARRLRRLEGSNRLLFITRQVIARGDAIGMLGSRPETPYYVSAARS